MIANDLSPTAAKAMRRNVEYNAMGAKDTAPTDNVHAHRPSNDKNVEWQGKVRVNEGDAMSVRSNRRTLSLAL